MRFRVCKLLVRATRSEEFYINIPLLQKVKLCCLVSDIYSDVLKYGWHKLVQQKHHVVLEIFWER